MELRRCPFCGGKAVIDTEYDSDDNHPDGNQHFVKCSVCGAQGEQHYASDINDMHLTKKGRLEKRERQNNAESYATKAWNKRTPPQPTGLREAVENAYRKGCLYPSYPKCGRCELQDQGCIWPDVKAALTGKEE